MVENVLPPMLTTSRPDHDQPPTPLGTVHKRREPQTADSVLVQSTAGLTTGDTRGNKPQHPLDVSEAVRSWVTQRQQGAPPTPFPL